MLVPLGSAALYPLVSVFYVFEGNYVSCWREAALDPFELMRDETPSAGIWIAAAAIFVGMYPVQPRPRRALAGGVAMGDS